MNLAEKINKEKGILEIAIVKANEEIKKTGIGDTEWETAQLDILEWIEKRIKHSVQELIKEIKCTSADEILMEDAKRIFGKELL